MGAVLSRPVSHTDHRDRPALRCAKRSVLRPAQATPAVTVGSVARVRAQAKINLFLHVGCLSGSARGFHELHTAFHRIDLADEIEVRVVDRERSLRCAGPRIPPGGLGPQEKNLAFRAAEVYSARAGWPRGFSIE